MNGNVFYEQVGHKMFGNQFGYAVEYELTRDSFGIARVKFVGSLAMPDDPGNWKRPRPIQLVSECILELLKKEKNVIANLYGVNVGFGEKHTIDDIYTTIHQIQLNLIKISPNVSASVRHYLEGEMREAIKAMPIE